jgi:hypothetical protein
MTMEIIDWWRIIDNLVDNIIDYLFDNIIDYFVDKIIDYFVDNINQSDITASLPSGDIRD